jgi:asparagine synthase (glutamine-hydrolysing)
MCGICAVVETGRPQGGIAAHLFQMHDTLAHRGPDGEGHLWIGAGGEAHRQHGAGSARSSIPDTAVAAAAFRWLKIQDLDARSNQPMASPDEKSWILFNGEIYNHLALRAELAALGERFQTRSDTEVVLAAYRRWGTSAFTRFEGMWGILIFDLAARKLILSRDRLGIKPLYYAFKGTRLLVASEPQSIALSGAIECRLERFRVHEFLRGLPPQSAELSFFDGVHPLPAGTWASVPLDGTPTRELSPQRFWSLADCRAEPLPESAFEAKREEFEALLVAALGSHAEAAVEVGTLLSGGLDTSMLARLLARHAQSRRSSPPKAFSIIYEDPAMSEWPYMQLVLEGQYLRGFNHVLKAEEAWRSVEDVVRAQGQPLLGQDTIAQYHAYRLARSNGCIVVLDGQGSDEILAGMPLYDAQQFPEMLRAGQLLRLSRELRARMLRYGLGLGEALSIYVKAPIAIRRMQDQGLPRFEWLDRSIDSSRLGAGRTCDGGPERSALNRFLYRHTRHTNLPAALMYQDRGSMAHGVESRVPFLDHRLVEFAFRLPEPFKVYLGVRKRILLETARKYLPSAIVERRDKRIFISKTGWMDLRRRAPTELREMAHSAEMRDSGLVKPPALISFVEDFLAGRHGNEMALWRLYTLWHWLRAFRPQP